MKWVRDGNHLSSPKNSAQGLRNIRVDTMGITDAIDVSLRCSDEDWNSAVEDNVKLGDPRVIDSVSGSLLNQE